MRPIAVFLSLFVVFAFPPPAYLQEVAATPQRDSQAVAALGQAIAALGGAGTGAVNDVTLTGTARRIAGSDDETGTAVLKALRTGEARIDLTFSSGQRSEVRGNSVNGPVGSWTGPDGVSHASSFHNLALDGRWFFPVLMFSSLNSSANGSLRDAGVETRGGRSVRHLTTIKSQQSSAMPAWAAKLSQHLSQLDLYLDPSSGLPVALAFNTHPDRDAGTDIPVEIMFSDYRVVNGVQVPFHVQKYLNNGLFLDLQFQSAVLNTGLPASSFNVQ
jgi:hypothetical protein